MRSESLRAKKLFFYKKHPAREAAKPRDARVDAPKSAAPVVNQDGKASSVDGRCQSSRNLPLKLSGDGVAQDKVRDGESAPIHGRECFGSAGLGENVGHKVDDQRQNAAHHIQMGVPADKQR